MRGRLYWETRWASLVLYIYVNGGGGIPFALAFPISAIRFISTGGGGGQGTASTSASIGGTSSPASWHAFTKSLNFWIVSAVGGHVPRS